MLLQSGVPQQHNVDCISSGHPLQLSCRAPSAIGLIRGTFTGFRNLLTPVMVVTVKQLSHKGQMQRGYEYIILCCVGLEITGHRHSGRHTDCHSVRSHLDKKV